MNNDFIVKMIDGSTLTFTGEDANTAFSVVEYAFGRGAVLTTPVKDAEGRNLTLIKDKILYYGEKIEE